MRQYGAIKGNGYESDGAIIAIKARAVENRQADETIKEQLMSEEEKKDELGELEKKFKQVFEAHGGEIAKLLADAYAALDAAEKLAKEHGIPFASGLSYNSDHYIPGTFAEKFPGIDKKFVSELTDIGTYTLSEAYGWTNSYC